MRYLILATLVIAYPYDGIDYEKINVYDLKTKEKYSIKTWEPEEETNQEKVQDTRPIRMYCYICEPPQWINL